MENKMSKKEIFINEIQNQLNSNKITLSQDALEFFNALVASNAGVKETTFTENGKRVLTFMQENKATYSNMFTAKSIAEGLAISSHGSSGALRKLVNDGYVEKIEGSPVTYLLSTVGEKVKFDVE
jgi:predicted HTH transcriptional regulator